MYRDRDFDPKGDLPANEAALMQDLELDALRANLCGGIFTHYKREEDTSMRSGKLDEELSRMSSIVDKMTPTSILLLNESFASTNEREGSEIARQLVQALLETGINPSYSPTV